MFVFGVVGDVPLDRRGTEDDGKLTFARGASFIFVEFRDGPSDSRGQFPQNLVFDEVVAHLGTTGT